jgi:hypothetical protein
MHNDEALVRFFANFIDGTDVRVIELGRRLCFSDQSLLCLLVCMLILVAEI